MLWDYTVLSGRAVCRGVRMVYIQTMVALDICSESLIYQREGFAGFRPSATRSFCFGKRTQNHRRPGVAPGGAFATVPIAWAAELASLRQSSPQNRLRDWGAATPEGAGR